MPETDTVADTAWRKHDDRDDYQHRVAAELAADAGSW
jgi:hypothetical protein